MPPTRRNAPKDKKKKIDVKEDDIRRRTSRKLVLLATKLTKSGIRTTWFRLPSNPVVEGFFTENVSGLDRGVIEFKKNEDKLDVLTRCLEVNRATILDKKDFVHDTGNLVTRILVDTKRVI